jgi:hypothetical protein
MSRLPSDRSPWTHTAGRSHGGASRPSSHAARSVHIDFVAQLLGAVAREAVGAGERPAALGRSQWRRPGRVDALECEHEPGQVDRQLAQGVGRGVRPRVLAHQPRRDVPAKGVAGGRLAHGERYRHFDREVGRQCGEPPGLFLSLLRRPCDLRQAHREVVAEAEDGVVGAPRLDPAQREAGELRELDREEPAHETVVDFDFDLVVVHPRDRHGRPCHCRPPPPSIRFTISP